MSGRFSIPYAYKLYNIGYRVRKNERTDVLKDSKMFVYSNYRK